MSLIAAPAADIASLAGPTAAGLPVTPALEDAAVLAMLADLARTVEASFAPAGWLIVDEGTIAGLLSLVAVPANGVIAIGYGIAPSRRGKGLATRAVGELLGISAADSRIVAVTAETATGNVASQRVLAANGFRRTGTRTDPDDGELLGWRIDLQ